LLNSADFQNVQSDSGFQPRENLIAMIRQQAASYLGDPGGLGVFLVGSQSLTELQLAKAETAAAKPIGMWSDNDWTRFTPLDAGARDLFAFSVGELFSLYNQAVTLNDYTEWQSREKGGPGEYLSAADFRDLHGEPPWEVLSRTLASMRLPYSFEAPAGSLVSTFSEPRLVDSSDGRPVLMAELSSGEKTLLRIAMSMYSVDSRQASVTSPGVVLLDEPDATLHPSMVRTMLNLVQSEIVGRLRVPVILTTHSPTTVALAEEESLFVMRRVGTPRLKKATKDEALKALLVGVPSVSVDAENRRTVIVESPNDERLYTAVLAALAPFLKSERSLQFMAAGSKDLADGCAAVIDLVSRLRANGNSKIWGLVDRDTRTDEPSEHIFFDPRRYAIENLIADPLSVGLLLLRDKNAQLVAQYDQANYLTFDVDSGFERQKLVDWVLDRVRSAGDDIERVEVTYAGGLQVKVERFWLDMNGHKLSARIVAAFPELNQHAHNGRLLDAIVANVWSERPRVAPSSTVELLFRFLAA